MLRYTMPSSFKSLDSTLGTDGWFYDADARVWTARNLNKVIGQDRAYINESWPLDAGEMHAGSPAFWSVARVWTFDKLAVITTASCVIRGEITNTDTVDVVVAPPGMWSPSNATTLTGTGNLIRYPTAPSVISVSLTEGRTRESVALFVKGEDLGVMLDKTNNTSGTYDEIRPFGPFTYFKASANGDVGVTDFTNLNDGGTVNVGADLGLVAWIGIKDSAGAATWRLPPARIVRVLSTRELLLAPGWNLAVSDVPSASAGGAPVWEMKKASALNLANIMLYPDEPSGA